MAPNLKSNRTGRAAEVEAEFDAVLDSALEEEVPVATLVPVLRIVLPNPLVVEAPVTAEVGLSG